MNLGQSFSEYFIISIGIIIFIIFPICALTNCICCRKKQEHFYHELP